METEDQEPWEYSPSPLGDFAAEEKDQVQKAWPEVTRECLPGADDFWELPKIPVGSVITFDLPSPKPEEKEAAIAVLILTVASDEHGWLYGVKFLGASEEWAKPVYGSLLNRQKRKIHICQVPPRECPAEAAAHLSSFTFWAPGKFSAGYVEKRQMKDMEKFLAAQQQKKEEQKAAAEQSAREKAAPPPPSGKPDGQETGPEKLAALRSRLVSQRGALPPVPGPSVHFQDQPSYFPARPGILKKSTLAGSALDPFVISSGGESEHEQPVEPEKKKRKVTVGSALTLAAQAKTSGGFPSQPVDVKKEGEGTRKKPKEKKSSKKSKKKKKKKEEPSSSSAYESDSTSSEVLPPLQRKAKKKPGSVLRLLMDHVMKSLSDASVLTSGDPRTAASAVNSPARVQSYFQILVRGHLGQRQRDEKELHSLAIALDALRDGDLERVADLLAGRYLAVETAALEGTWDTAKWLEVSPLAEKGAAGTGLLLEARKHQKTVEKAAGRGSYGNSAQSWGWNSGAGNWGQGGGNYGSPQKGKGDGKGRKGKPKGGKGKKGQDYWRQEAPKGAEQDKTQGKDAAKS